MKLDFELGDKVVVQAVLEKHKEYDSNTYRTVTKYVNKGIPPIIGIYIGYRTALTGSTCYGEDGPEFRSTGSVTYLLVVTNPRCNPIKVDPNFAV